MKICSSKLPGKVLALTLHIKEFFDNFPLGVSQLIELGNHIFSFYYQAIIEDALNKNQVEM